MEEFSRMADAFAGIVLERSRNGGIRAKEIPDLIGEISGQGNHAVNCYPGDPSFGCCELAFFISLKAPTCKKGRGHLTFREAIEKIVHHMQGACAEKTHFAVLLTDSWDPQTYADWRPNLQKLTGHVEAYLIIDGGASEINFNNFRRP